MEGQGRSREVMDGIFPLLDFYFSGQKCYRIIVSAPVPVPFLWTLDLGPGFGTWIRVLDLGLDLGLTINIACLSSERTFSKL